METLAQEVAIAKARKTAFYHHIAQKEAAAAERAKKKAAVEEQRRIRRESASKAADEKRFEEMSTIGAGGKAATAGTKAGWSRLRKARMEKEMVERAGRIGLEKANSQQYTMTATPKTKALPHDISSHACMYGINEPWLLVCRVRHPCHKSCCHCYLEGLMDGLYAE